MKRLIYSGTILVEMDPKDYDRLSLHHFDTRLADEEAGVVVGNKMIYSVQLTNTIDLVSEPISLWEAGLGVSVQRREPAAGQLRATAGRPARTTCTRGSPWAACPADGTDRRTAFYTAKPVPSEGIPLREAGINRPVEGLYLSEAYAVPEQECWGFLAIGECQIKAERSTSHFDMGSGLIYDVLPPTLDGFYQLTQKGDGWALAWGQEGDLTFPTLYDADGDGLSRTDDPDDSKWDADGDGLSDVYELNTGSDPHLVGHRRRRADRPPGSPVGQRPGQRRRRRRRPVRLPGGVPPGRVVGDENVREVCGDVVGAWSGGWTIVYGMDERRTLEDPRDLQPRRSRHRRGRADRPPGVGLRLQPHVSGRTRTSCP